MLAIEHRFDDALPGDLFLDTDIVVSYLVGNQPYHAASRAFIDRVSRDSETTVYVSTLSPLEYAQVVSRDRFRRELPEELSRLLRNYPAF